ncbi:putative protein [Methanobacterium congolense]|uniref:Uncharacterized protein n=2 Tax=Methanobacterium congolense TaxID=118062 RepID=A0A1D3L1Q4_9EURY|nr:putative protein [Methanobacterium congolense]
MNSVSCIINCGGSVSVDFILSTMVFLMVLTSLVAMVEDRMDSAEDAEELGTGRMMVEYVAETVDSVYSGGNGHSAVITLPPSINGDPYTITLISGAVFMDVHGLRGQAVMFPGAISGNEFKMYSSRSYNISNIQKSENYSEIVVKEIK